MRNRVRNLSGGRLIIAAIAVVAWFVPAAVGQADEHAEAGAWPKPPGTLEFKGHNLFGDADGTFHAWRVLESEVDLEKPAESFVVVEIDLESVDTGIGRRDAHLRDPDFFETETYPTATARVHTPREIEPDEEGKRRFQAQFHVDLHGVQKTLVGEITLESESPLVFEGELMLNRMDFGVGPEPSGWNPMSPRAEIPVRFRVEL